MKNRLPLLIILSLPLIFILFLVVTFNSTAALAVTSNCIVTKIGTAPGDPQMPPACNSGGGAQGVVALAKAHLNGIYVWGAPARNWASEDPNAGKTPTTFDCSGFAGWAWYWGTNGKVNLPGQTDAVWTEVGGLWQRHVSTNKDELQPGDLLYFGSVVTTHHVGIYEGAGTCGTAHCFLEYYQNNLPGRENALEKEPDYVGYVRPLLK
ncbi:MAG: C40 family peptidase [Candidatus Levyibacteriota bacterium]